MKKILCACLAGFLAFACHAARVDTKGIVELSFAGTKADASKPTEAERAVALSQAKQNAWKAYVAGLNAAKQQIIRDNATQFLARLNDYIIDFVVIDSTVDIGNKNLRLVARVGFNSELVDGDAAAFTKTATERVAGEENQFAFLFISRQETSRRVFDIRNDKVKRSEELQEKDPAGTQTRQTVNSEGGSNLKKGDEVNYKASSSLSFDTAISDILGRNRIEFVPYAEWSTAPECNAVPAKQIQNEYITEGQLKDITEAKMLKSAWTCEMSYFAYGTVDTSLAEKDPVSGNQKVTVSATIKLMAPPVARKSARFSASRTVAAVGPVQFIGYGQDESVAARNAVQKAAEEIGKTLVDQMTAKNIR